ncbi:hypothetical protein NDU88_002419 [Pleurodeles waltl]|uniref:Uncharacterized protein n=1 Tax=Pleurodeles waltl TaxID=8319 RepID=A0AAV7M3W0_PLEWA|nr:hypothetical protein NDU88_002419 [Pleurodeles waltl]
MVTSVRVLETLRVLQEEGREDLLQQGVLDQEGMGLKRPRRVSSEGVTAAVMACSSPVSGKKIKQKSIVGRRYAQSGADCEVVEGFDLAGLPSGFAWPGGAVRGSHDAQEPRLGSV